MSFKSKLFHLSFLLALVASLSAAAMADTIRLKDGSRVKGKIVSFSGGRFVVAVGEGSRRRQMTFSSDEVESIEFEATQFNTAAADRNVSSVRVVENIPAAVINPPKTRSEPVVQSPPPVSETARKVSYGKPVEIAVKVLADNTANGWTNSGYVVKKGQRIRISGTGEVSIGSGKTTGPSGLYDVQDNQKLLKSVPTGALIAVIGDDNNEFIYIGSEREFTASRDGILFLGLNEGNLNDNSGSFNVKVEIAPDGGE